MPWKVNHDGYTYIAQDVRLEVERDKLYTIDGGFRPLTVPALVMDDVTVYAPDAERYQGVSITSSTCLVRDPGPYTIEWVSDLDTPQEVTGD